MVDITHKSHSLRYARAVAVITFGDADSIPRILDHRVPKGNVLESARVAALFAVKKTSELIPDCHPLPIEYAAVDFYPEGNTLRIEMEIKTIYKTGVEVEAMHGVSVAALTVYDMMKPVDQQIEIGGIRLLEKRGGKSERLKDVASASRAAVVVCSDSIAAGQAVDKAGPAVMERLEKHGFSKPHYVIVPDEIDSIRRECKLLVAQGFQLVLFVGGTGLSPRDVTPEALRPMLERSIPGIEETMRNYGQLRMPYAMLSRSVAGMIGDALVLALPGSTKGAGESMDAVFPALLHLFHVLRQERHDGTTGLI